MKKFIFTANVIALLFLVPAVLFGYLNNSSNKETKAATEVASEPVNSQDNSSILRLVKSF